MNILNSAPMITDTPFHWFTYFLLILALIFFIQGLAVIELIPLYTVTLFMGINVDSGIGFFFYPAAFFIFRFILIFIQMVLAGNSPKLLTAAIHFNLFMGDFFRWVLALWFGGMTIGGMLTINLIPNTNPPLLFVLTNFYLAFFIYFLAMRRLMGGDYFDFISKAIPNIDSRSQAHLQHLGVGSIKKFFSTIGFLLLTGIGIAVLLFTINLLI